MCQVNEAVSALVASWWLDLPTSKKLVEATAERLRHKQARNAKSRKSHHKKTIRRYHKLGINVSKIKRCRWPSM